MRPGTFLPWVRRCPRWAMASRRVGERIQGDAQPRYPARGFGFAASLLAVRLRGRSVVAFVALLSALGLSATAQASPGDLDPSFSGDGIADAFSENSYFWPAAIRASNGGIIVAGDSARYYTCLRGNGCHTDRHAVIARFLADGSLDPSYGDGGIATIGPDDHRALSYRGFVVTGSGDAYGISSGDFSGPFSSGDYLSLLHFNPDGSFDPDYQPYPAPGMSVSDIAEDPSGKLVFTSWKYAAPGHVELRIGRLNGDGSLDDTFGTDGSFKAMDLPDSAADSGEIAVSGDGSVAVTVGSFGLQTADALVARYNPDGTPVASFGTDGVATIDIGRLNEPRSIVPVGGGGWIVGIDTVDTDEDVPRPPIGHIVRLDSSGEIVSAFGHSGQVEVPERSTLDVTPDGKILASSSQGLARFNSDGSVDSTFGGGDGLVGTPWLAGWPVITITGPLAVLPNGRVARFGDVVNRGGTTIVMHGNSAGPPNADADELLDGADACPEVPAATDDGCPHLEFGLNVISHRAEGRIELRLHGDPVCKEVSDPFALIRRRGGKVKRFPVEGSTREVLTHGSGKYYVRIRKRTIPDIGTCPTGRSKTVRVQGNDQ